MDINVSLDTVITMVAWAMLATGGQLCWKKTHCIVDNQYDTKLVYCLCEMALLKTNNYSKTRNKKKKFTTVREQHCYATVCCWYDPCCMLTNET